MKVIRVASFLELFCSQSHPLGLMDIIYVLQPYSITKVIPQSVQVSGHLLIIRLTQIITLG